MVERTLNHEVGWVLVIEDIIDALWVGTIEPVFEGTHASFRKLVGYKEEGKEVLFDEPERVHVS